MKKKVYRLYLYFKQTLFKKYILILNKNTFIIFLVIFDKLIFIFYMRIVKNSINE